MTRRVIASFAAGIATSAAVFGADFAPWSPLTLPAPTLAEVATLTALASLAAFAIATFTRRSE